MSRVENFIVQHDPIMAYRRKETEFLNRKFYVDRRVYIPNPETELMVRYAIDYIKENGLTKGTFIDVGTGCGNIAISLAKEFPEAKIIATDISNDALSVARVNVEKHQVKNVHLHTDLIKDVQTEPDLIIGNLPWGDEDHLLQTNAKETLALMPEVAIFSPDGIIGSYIRLCEQIRSKNWNTVLIAEVGLLERETIEINMPEGFDWNYIPIAHEYFIYSILKISFEKSSICPLVHHHLIYQAETNRPDLTNDSNEILKKFLNDLVELIEMKILIPPQVAYSSHEAWTGIVGIVTSHISFHFWTFLNQIQLDIYSCKEFDVNITVDFLNQFWNAQHPKAIFIERGLSENFTITKF